ncbi:hypothetical protein D051_0075 [Vibrio parahaemolyticus VPCR-2010]|uniref:type IVB secretion system protein IcmW n=1 Tax=Vibrio parahaemolyticus TaxID=670 RepID=UPI00038E7233|nr:hypothetical protein [Vibrio parahaemolyticus]EQM48043.1 hypothetical protein D051_0075 [Vibrio parahaemolyticus VPCR-2010]EGR5929798.1 hypothetical protein [Vibrio parahaemolyticus]EJG0181411.1 hypothetical protein [Vibrio parahaemolyticus]KOY40136.1 hypothetical protein ACX10_06730 [Vibrio parahaemolyticus]MCS0116589.1 hypothetical protein [Vibrio parahaemolyticus]
MKNNSQDIFSPGFQDLFWGTLEPDFRSFMNDLENKEVWTHKYEEFPDMFKQLADLLPHCDEVRAMKADNKTIRDFIAVLSAMPARQSLSALSWLDSQSSSETRIGWGAKIFLECADIYKNKQEDPLKLEAKAVYKRVQSISQTRLLVDLFVNEAIFGEKK